MSNENELEIHLAYAATLAQYAKDYKKWAKRRYKKNGEVSTLDENPTPPTPPPPPPVHN